MIVRCGLAELPGVLGELALSRPLLISTERWRHGQLPVHDRFPGVRAHAEIAGVTAAREAVGSVAGNGRDLQARRGLLEGAMHAGAALHAGMRLGHAIAQALGGRYGLPHGTMNAVSLPAALRVNSIAAAGELARFGEAIGYQDPAARVSELAALADPSKLRDYQVPRQDLPGLAQTIAELPAAKTTRARRRRTSWSSYSRKRGDQTTSQMSESTPISHHPRRPQRW